MDTATGRFLREDGDFVVWDGARPVPVDVTRLTGVSEVDLRRLAEFVADGPLCYDTYNGVE
ncbi:hypothetical protein [Actinophytocola sp.]|uniref:hypothetical protein n=1 Tax=Actinophytocola sp. TaxID=1872138 RepID=UPI003D6C3DA1